MRSKFLQDLPLQALSKIPKEWNYKINNIIFEVVPEKIQVKLPKRSHYESSIQSFIIHNSDNLNEIGYHKGAAKINFEDFQKNGHLFSDNIIISIALPFFFFEVDGKNFRKIKK